MLVGLPPSPFLYPILDTEFSPDPIRDAKKLIRAGVKILQVRAKNQLKRTLYRHAVEMASLCIEKEVCFIVNDEVDIVMVTDASGVHLGQEDFPLEPARGLLGMRIIGVSTHNPEQFFVAQNSPIDYIAIGPVYSTTTKRTSNPVLGIKNITPLLEQKSKPVVAIGGIRTHNLRELVSAGFDGIALISELYRNGDLYDNACRLIEEINR